MEKEKKNKFFDKEIDPSISRKRKILDIKMRNSILIS